MPLEIKDIRKWDGQISREPFVLWATVLFGFKYNLDRLLVRLLFHRQWSVLSYFDQPVPGLQYISPAQNPMEAMILLAASIPFLWAGVFLCVKRLRSAHFPLWLAVLFVVPIAKWFLFIILAIVPEREGAETKSTRVFTWLPKSAFGSGALAVVVSTIFSILAMALSASFLHDYGWGLFVGVPFSMGFFSSIIYGAREPRRLRQSITVAMISVFVAGALLLVLAFEGVICLVMAAPLALILAIIGAVVGHAIQVRRPLSQTPHLFCTPFLALPLIFAAEILRPGPVPLLKVVTSIEVNAPVETVWKHVVEFSELPPPTEILFKLGIAYPIRAEIQGRGPRAIRNCIFSTGPFVEPIDVWDEPHLLKFSVTSNPAPLDEWTPYKEIHPPHLKGFLVSEQGQFELTPLPGGRTLLAGTTWYHHTLWPVDYWQVWSDQIIHAIHHRVLMHVKNLSEMRPS